MQKIRHKRNYKFTEKRHSKLAIAAFGLAIASVVLFFVVVYNSFLHDGNGSMYLGSAGVATMFLAFVSFVMAVWSLKDENAFRLFPYLATVASFLALGGWVVVYLAGFGIL